ncbi:GlxA family transcriptional regulator [Kiloniella sp. b19]|uniref:GlxA family transcriptional regulator n=1 Tax=Kiloniella sp. GXU_MW_B19 TaxID=3141326 RepID=UPI0031D38F56
MKTICIHVSAGFPVLSLTLITEPLRLANRELGREEFIWSIISDEGGTLHSSSNLPITTDPLPDSKPDAVIVLTSYRPDRSATPRTLSWLRKLDRLGCLMGCVDTGALVFAKAGLLNTRPAATHPEAISGFLQQFPNSLFIDRLMDFSPPRLSSAGGVATLDMTLALIAHFNDETLSGRIAEILTYKPLLHGPDPQQLPRSIAPEIHDAVSIMEANLSRCLGIAEIADRVGLPVWKLTRLFKRYLHSSPTSYYMKRRLVRARDMLRNSTLPVGDIAIQCGYENAEAFSRAYRNRYGKPPSEDRGL